jgi:hypothetical protein
VYHLLYALFTVNAFKRFINRLSPHFLIVLAPIVLLAPALFGGQAIYYGTVSLQFHPWRVYALETLRAGALPLWNPLNGLGAPLLANYQSAFLYPPNWLIFLFGLAGGGQAMAWAQVALVAAHLIWAGWGMARLVRALGYGELPQAVGGLAFGLSGYLVARSHFPSINAAVAWLPWVMAGVWKLANASDPLKIRELVRTQRGLLFSLTMLLLAGHAQTAWYTLLLAGAWAIYWGWRVAHSQINWGDHLPKAPIEPPQFSPAPPQAAALVRAIRVPAAFAVLVLLAAALAAVQLLPTAELLLQSQRAAGADYEFAMTYSFWQWRFIGLLAPGFFGSPAAGDYWGYANFWEDAIYIGLLPVLLALRALFQRRQPGDSKLPLTKYLLLVTILSFLLALGRNTPVFPFLYRHIPTFNLFQAPTRFSIWAVFSLALLAALGAERWQADASPKTRRRAGRWLAAALAVLLAALAARTFVPGLEPSFARAAALAGGTGIAIGLIALHRGRGPRWVWLASGLVAVDLLIAGWGLNPTVPLEFYEPLPRQETSGRRYLPDADEYRLTFDHLYRFDTFATDPAAIRAALLPNMNLLAGIPSANNFDPLLAGRYAAWIAALETADAATRDWMLAEMGVTELETQAGAGAQVNLTPVAGAPRLQFFPCASPAASAGDAWAQLAARANQNAVILENLPAGGAAPCSGGTGTAALLAETPNALRIRVNAGTPGWLLVRDTYYPGWIATVNGARAEVHPANFLFRAVPVPAGESEVVLRYQPLSFYIGALVSGLAWMGVVILGVIYRKGGTDSIRPLANGFLTTDFTDFTNLSAKILICPACSSSRRIQIRL